MFTNQISLCILQSELEWPIIEVYWSRDKEELMFENVAPELKGTVDSTFSGINLKKNYDLYLGELDRGVPENLSLKKVLDTYNLVPNDESIFEECTKDRVVEVYLYRSFNPIFLNKRFFDLVSYDTETVSGENIFELFTRNKNIEKETLAEIEKTSTELSKFTLNIPDTIIHESKGEGRYFHNKYRWITGLRFDGIYPMGFINVMDAFEVPDDKISILWGN